jgi:hypothetical protein
VQPGSFQALLALTLIATLAFGPCHGDAAAAADTQHGDSPAAAVSDAATTARVKARIAEGRRLRDTAASSELRLARSQ